MALIKEEDIKDLQNKKADAETTIRATKDAFDKASNDVSAASDEVKSKLDEQRGENPNSLESLNSLVKDFEAKLLIPGEIRRKFDPTGISLWGELVYELVDVDFVEANEDDWTTIRAARDQGLKQESDKQDQDLEIKLKGFIDNISSEEDKARLDKAFEVLRDVYMSAFKATVELENNKIVKEKVEELLTKFIKEIDNSDLVIRFNKEKEERKEAIADSFKRADRQKALLKENHEDLKSEKEALTSDNDLIQKEFAAEMGISGDGDDVLVKESLSRLKEKQNAFTASNALELTRDSLFNLEIIIEKIKEACVIGLSNIKMTGDDISGTQIYSLIDLGYKITHEKINKPGRNRDNTINTKDWTFAPTTT